VYIPVHKQPGKNNSWKENKTHLFTDNYIQLDLNNLEQDKDSRTTCRISVCDISMHEI